LQETTSLYKLSEALRKNRAGSMKHPAGIPISPQKQGRLDENERSLMSWELRPITHIHLPEDT
jgi:hypothetical protein